MFLLGFSVPFQFFPYLKAGIAMATTYSVTTGALVDAMEGASSAELCTVLDIVWGMKSDKPETLPEIDELIVLVRYLIHGVLETFESDDLDNEESLALKRLARIGYFRMLAARMRDAFCEY